MQVLSNILLSVEENQLVISATNLEVGICIRVPAEVTSTGKVTVHAKNLYEIVKELPDREIQLEKTENHWLSLKCNKAHFNIVALPHEDFPSFPSNENTHYISIQCKSLRDMINKTIFSVSNDETRYHLNGVYFEPVEENHIRMVATDAHRLALIDGELFSNENESIQEGVIIPKRGLLELKRLVEEDPQGSLQVSFDQKHLFVKFHHVFLYIRLISGTYPNYKQVIPQSSTKKVMVARDPFLHSLKRVSLLADEKSRGVKLNLKKSVLEISSTHPERGEAREELEIEFNGDDLEIGFNARYLMDCLSAIQSDEVKLEFNDQHHPGVIRSSENDRYTCVVMPMKV
jgi:DNA polymerase-3 subunit beta